MHARNRHKLLTKGEDKFIKEFDAEYFVDTMRKVHLLLAATMDDNERFLSKYQQLNTVKLIEDFDQSDSDDPDLLPQSLPKLKSDPEEIAQHQFRVSEFMRKFQDEGLTEKGIKLLKGTYSNKSMKNKEVKQLGFNTLIDNNFDKKKFRKTRRNDKVHAVDYED